MFRLGVTTVAGWCGLLREGVVLDCDGQQLSPVRLFSPPSWQVNRPRSYLGSPPGSGSAPSHTVRIATASQRFRKPAAAALAGSPSAPRWLCRVFAAPDRFQYPLLSFSGKGSGYFDRDHLSSELFGGG